MDFDRVLRGVLRPFLKKPAPAPKRVETPFPPPRPDGKLAVIGDVHGMLGPLERLLDRVAREHPEAKVISVGDLIDRGERSAEVLRLAHARRGQLHCLLGNHEEMLLRFLEAPETEAARWFRNGGLQTMASFGIGPIGLAPDGPACVDLRDRLRAALGPEIEAWLRSLPRFLQSGSVVVTHAGADPWLPIDRQPPQALTWGASDFGRRRRTDGIWIVHGHTIVDQPRAADGVISVDTGAFAGGALTLAVIEAGGVRFLQDASQPGAKKNA